ncbi:hypothetical protein [Actinophytocola oryzae]|uniref:Uncharacterized protein n=1 Tax=Actinophytocola oryzae TaxID=502181 RepID=A0A4R7V2U2_9PSEU|nr:hypothetical protein [Actinophytocola oryzae]TDV43170.1 hypothetical protein CLV71_116104 [Actinophytocola oryzae]
MAEVALRDGLDPKHPERVVLAVAIDPEGSAGERAVAVMGDYCFPDEEQGLGHILATDGFTECHLDDGVVTVDIMLYPSPARADPRIDEADFPDRSTREPLAIRVLRVTGTTTRHELPEETLVYLTPLTNLTEDDEPLVFAPAPEH